jgi:hypothetical protein
LLDISMMRYFDLLRRSAWSLLTSVAGFAGYHYDTIF